MHTRTKISPCLPQDISGKSFGSILSSITPTFWEHVKFHNTNTNDENIAIFNFTFSLHHEITDSCFYATEIVS